MWSFGKSSKDFLNIINKTKSDQPLKYGFLSLLVLLLTLPSVIPLPYYHFLPEKKKGLPKPIYATWPHSQSTFVDLSENTAFAVLSV